MSTPAPASIDAGMFTTIEAPAPPTAPSTGLLAAVPPTGGVAHWEDGVAWQPATGASFGLFAPCEETEPLDLPAPRELVAVVPVGYRVLDASSGRRGVDLDASSARAQAGVMASYALARELWTGEGTRTSPRDLPQWLGGTSGYVNPYLADAARCSTIAGTHDPVVGLGLLEGAAYDALGGMGVPVLHVPPRVLLAVAEKLTARGSVLYTPAGTPVIADGGYPGTGPGGVAGTWAYATGPVVTRLGEVFTDTDPASTFLRSINFREVYAARMFAVGFDPSCHLGVALDVPVPVVTAPGGTP